MPNLDLFIYRDFDSGDVELEVGDDAPAKLGSAFNGLQVVALGPPIHEGKDRTVVLASQGRPMETLRSFFSRLEVKRMMQELAEVDPDAAEALKDMEDEGLI